MAFDEGLAQRIREHFAPRRPMVEKKMFGGLAVMLDGHMAVGILGETLMARVGPLAYDKALKMRHVRPMDFTGKPMKGYVFVDPPGFESDPALADWIARCESFVATLPPK
jgi:hypothetical protein